MTEEEIQSCLDAGRFTEAMANRWREMSARENVEETPTMAETRAELRQEIINDWRNERTNALWRGDGIDAMVDCIHLADMEDVIAEFLSMAFTFDPDKRALKLFEIKKRMIEQTVEHEEDSGQWK